MFFLVVVFVLTLLHGYVGVRLIAPYSLSGNSLFIFWSLTISLAVAPLSGLVFRSKGIENNITDMLLWIGYTSLGFFSLAFIIFLIKDLSWLTRVTISNVMMLFNGADQATPVFDSGRRQFILMSINYGIIGLTGTLGIMGLFQARRRPNIVRQQVHIRNLPEEHIGLKIVQISDLHVGPTIKADYVHQVVNQVNELKPDLIFFTGDMVDGSVDHLADDVEPLRDLRANYGKYFVTGNHEYYSGVELWEEKVKSLGFIHLKNEHQIVEIGGAPLAIAGVTDLMAHHSHESHRSDPPKAVAGIPDSMPTILLAHQPGSASQAEGLHIDLMVCGHTHGGQFIPFNYAVARVHPYVAGLYQHGDMQVYVNQGTGYWGPPLRLGIPAEITLFELG